MAARGKPVVFSAKRSLTPSPPPGKLEGMRPRLFVFALGLSLLAVGTSLAQAPSGDADENLGRSLYYAALEQARQGQLEKALGGLEQVLTQCPHDPFADDALAEKARLLDEVRMQPEAALAAWRSLVERYPSSRLVRRARARIAFLQSHLDQGGSVLAAYQAILRRAVSEPVERSVAEMERLLDEKRDFSLRPDGLLWMAGALLRDHQVERARAILKRIVAEYPDHRSAPAATSRLAQLEIGVGDLDAAERAYSQLAQRWPAEADGAHEGLARVGALIFRARLIYSAMGLWAFALLGAIAFLGLRLRRGVLTWRRLWPPPLEAGLYLLTMLGLILLVWGRARQTTHALMWMTGILLPALLVNGWLWRSQRPGVAGALLWCLGGLVVCLTAAVTAIALAGMLDQVLHTLEFGTG